MANKKSLNRVILIGNVGKEPEITHIPSLNKDVAKFSLATTEVYMDKTSNQWKDLTEWHNIVAWGWAAKKIERSVGRGTLVLVEGKIKTRKWKDKNDQDHWTTEIHADSVTPLDRMKNESNGSYGGNQNNNRMNSGQGGGNQYPYGGNNYGSPPMDDPYGNMQAPPEAQIGDINDIPYDDSDPF